MKKLAFNEITKEIDIIEQKEINEIESSENENLKKKSERIRYCLERNKIFFEIFSLFFIGVMSIILSFFGWKTDKRSSDIYEKQLEIMNNDREPYFKIRSEEIYEEVEETEFNNTIAIRRYTISNEGGKIRDVSIVKECCAIIYVQKYKHFVGKYNIFKYTFLDFFFNTKDSAIRQNINDGEDIVFYEYGIERNNKEYIEKNEFTYEDIFSMIDEELYKTFLRDIKLQRKNFVEITYTNYKNEKCTKRFEFTNDNMWISNKAEEGFSLLNNTETEIEKIPEEVKRRIENWLKSNKSYSDMY